VATTESDTTLEEDTARRSACVAVKGEASAGGVRGAPRLRAGHGREFVDL
jgi:hypothetical protein